VTVQSYTNYCSKCMFVCVCVCGPIVSRKSARELFCVTRMAVFLNGKEDCPQQFDETV